MAETGGSISMAAVARTEGARMTSTAKERKSMTGAEVAKALKGPDWRDMTPEDIGQETLAFVGSDLGKTAIAEAGGESRLKGFGKSALGFVKENWKSWTGVASAEALAKAGNFVSEEVKKRGIADATKAAITFVKENPGKVVELASGVAIGVVVKRLVQAGAIASGMEAYVASTLAVGGALTGAIGEARKIHKETKASPESEEKRATLKALMRNKGRLSKAALNGGINAVVGYYIGSTVTGEVTELLKQHPDADPATLVHAVGEKVHESISVKPAYAEELGNSDSIDTVNMDGSETIDPSYGSGGSGSATPSEAPATPQDNRSWWQKAQDYDPRVIAGRAIAPYLGMGPASGTPDVTPVDPAVVAEAQAKADAMPETPKVANSRAGEPWNHAILDENPNAERVIVAPEGPVAGPALPPEAAPVAPPVEVPVDPVAKNIKELSEMKLASGETPWALSEKLLHQANPDPEFKPTDEQIMAVDKALILAQVDKDGNHLISVPRWGIEGATLDSKLPAGTEFKVTDEVRQAIYSQIKPGENLADALKPTQVSLTDVPIGVAGGADTAIGEQITMGQSVDTGGREFLIQPTNASGEIPRGVVTVPLQDTDTTTGDTVNMDGSEDLDPSYGSAGAPAPAATAPESKSIWDRAQETWKWAQENDPRRTIPRAVGSALGGDGTPDVTPVDPAVVAEAQAKADAMPETPKVADSKAGEPWNHAILDENPNAEKVLGPVASIGPALPPVAPAEAPPAIEAPVDPIVKNVREIPAEMKLSSGSNPWTLSEELLHQANPDPEFKPTDEQIMAVDKALILAQVDADGKHLIAVPRWGIEGATPDTKLPVGTEFKVTDEVRQAIYSQIKPGEELPAVVTPTADTSIDDPGLGERTSLNQSVYTGENPETNLARHGGGQIGGREGGLTEVNPYAKAGETVKMQADASLDPLGPALSVDATPTPISTPTAETVESPEVPAATPDNRSWWEKGQDYDPRIIAGKAIAPYLGLGPTSAEVPEGSTLGPDLPAEATAVPTSTVTATPTATPGAGEEAAEGPEAPGEKSLTDRARETWQWAQENDPRRTISRAVGSALGMGPAGEAPAAAEALRPESPDEATPTPTATVAPSATATPEPTEEAVDGPEVPEGKSALDRAREAWQWAQENDPRRTIPQAVGSALGGNQTPVDPEGTTLGPELPEEVTATTTSTPTAEEAVDGSEVPGEKSLADRARETWQWAQENDPRNAAISAARRAVGLDSGSAAPTTPSAEETLGPDLPAEAAESSSRLPELSEEAEATEVPAPAPTASESKSIWDRANETWQWAQENDPRRTIPRAVGSALGGDGSPDVTPVDPAVVAEAQAKADAMDPGPGPIPNAGEPWNHAITDENPNAERVLEPVAPIGPALPPEAPTAPVIPPVVAAPAAEAPAVPPAETDFLNEPVVIDHPGDTFWESAYIDEGWRNENGVSRGDVVKDMIRQFARLNGNNLDLVHEGDKINLKDVLTEDQIKVIREANATKDTGDYWFKVRPQFLAELKKELPKAA